MSVTESSGEAYKPHVFSEPSIAESMDDESFTCCKTVDDNTSESDLKLKCAQSGSFNKDFSYEFSSDNSGASHLKALEDGISNPLRGNRELVGDSKMFPLANKASTISDDRFEEINDRYLMSSSYTIHKPKDSDRRFDVIKENEHYGLAIPRAHLDCGLRFPIHPFIQRIIDEAGVGLSQLLPNSFLHINAFIDWCLDRKIKRQSSLFWTHFRLLQNKVKSPGFYTIALKPNSKKLVVAPGNYHHAHEEWFFISGPDLKKFAKWKTFEAVSHAPELSDAEEEDYKKLTRPYNKSMIITQKESRSEAYLIDIGVSGVDNKIDLLYQRLLKSKQKENSEAGAKNGTDVSYKDKEQRAPKKRMREKSDITGTKPSNKETINTEDVNLSHSDGAQRDGKLITKKTRVGDIVQTVDFPEIFLEKASSSSISFGRKVKSMLSLPGDQVAAQKYSCTEGFTHMLGHLSQVYSWAIQLSEKDQRANVEGAQLKELLESEAKKVKLAHARIAQLEKDMLSMKSNMEKLKKQLTNAQATESKLNKVISDQSKEIEAAEETFYKAAIDRKLKKAKELFGDAYIGLMDPWDKDPNVEEVNLVANVEVANPTVASPSAESHTNDEIMINDASKEKTMFKDNP